MSKKFGFKAMMLSILLIVLLMLGIALNGYAQEPPAGSKITGKAIDGILSAVVINLTVEGAGVYDVDCPIVVQTIVGTCNSIPFVIGPLINNPIVPPTDDPPSGTIPIDDVTEDLLEGSSFPDAGPPGCYSAEGGEELIITRVTNFSNTGEALGASISLRKIEP